MIDQRTMQKPGEGIVRPGGSATEHQRYPLHMRHPGFQPGIPDKEIKVVDENGRPTGQLLYRGSQPIRYPDVLVHDADTEARHAADGYRPLGKSDPAAFAKAVAAAVPVKDSYQPVEYPKWVNGKLFNSAEEEAAALGTEPPGASAPGENTTTDIIVAEQFRPPSEAEKRLDVVEKRLDGIEDKMSAGFAQLAALLTGGAPQPASPSSEMPVAAPAVDTEVNMLEVFPVQQLEPPPVIFREPTEPKQTPQQKRLATLARKKAEREAAK